MPFLGSALGLTAMFSLGWGNLVAFDWNDLPVGREFDCKFLKKVKSLPHALPPPPAGITLTGALGLSVYVTARIKHSFYSKSFPYYCFFHQFSVLFFCMASCLAGWLAGTVSPYSI